MSYTSIAAEATETANLALKVSVVSMLLSVTVLLFGNQFIFRIRDSWRARSAARSERLAQIDLALSTWSKFLQGLPLFLRRTWDWGPSVPNYGVEGITRYHLPDDALQFAPRPGDLLRPRPAPRLTISELIPVYNIASEASEIYFEHSRTEGRAGASADEVSERVSQITSRYWDAVDEFCKREWWWGAKKKRDAYRALKIPDEEAARLLAITREGEGLGPR